MSSVCWLWPSAFARTAWTPQIDQYVAGTPAEGWPRWMLDRLDWAKVVPGGLYGNILPTLPWHEQPGQRQGSGLGRKFNHAGDVRREKHKRQNTRQSYLMGQNERFIPEPLRGHTRYLLTSEENYDKFYFFLIGQAGVRLVSLDHSRRWLVIQWNLLGSLLSMSRRVNCRSRIFWSVTRFCRSGACVGADP